MLVSRDDVARTVRSASKSKSKKIRHVKKKALTMLRNAIGSKLKVCACAVPTVAPLQRCGTRAARWSSATSRPPRHSQTCSDHKTPKPSAATSKIIPVDVDKGTRGGTTKRCFNKSSPGNKSRRDLILLTVPFLNDPTKRDSFCFLIP